MSINIKRIVMEDVSNNTNQYHILFEAIMNSIQADSTRIVCRLYSSPILHDDTGEITHRKVEGIDIEDNGSGFDDENFKSFKQYRTDHKITYGCKGVGRFSFLKIFSEVNYTSEIAKDKIRRTFPLNFELDDLTPTDFEDDNISENKTILSLREYTTAYITYQKERERRIELNISEIKKKVLTHLMPILHFQKNDGALVRIEFVDDLTGEIQKIQPEDIPDFSPEEFELPDMSGGKVKFTLRYKLNNTSGPIQAYSCADHRSVLSFSDTGLKISFPDNVSGYFLLESDYLDRNVDNNRNTFNIYPRQENMLSPISWNSINQQLKQVIAKIVKNNIPEAIELNRKILQQIQNERPYLVEYIQDDDIDLAGFLDKKEIIANAKRRFDAMKESLLENVGKKSYSNKELGNAIQIAQSELVSYIMDRVITIETLKTMLGDKEKCEQVIHNLFMPKNSSGNYYAMDKNNLWLFDDRFIAYSYAASNKTINTVLTQFSDNPTVTGIESDRPDMALFFPQNPEKPNGDLKSVIIELKPFDYDSKPAREKFAGLTQLRDYIEAFQAQSNIKEVWAFLLTEVDDTFAAALKKDGYKPLFSTNTPIYFRYYEVMDTFIYVISASTLIADAEARNKAFIDIINKHSKLQKFLEKANSSDDIVSAINSACV